MQNLKMLHGYRPMCQLKGPNLNNNFDKEQLEAIRITRNCQKCLYGNQLPIFLTVTN